MSYKSKAEELDAEFNEDGDGEHPEYTRAMWREAVADESTLFGYWEWVSYVM